MCGLRMCFDAEEWGHERMEDLLKAVQKMHSSQYGLRESIENVGTEWEPSTASLVLNLQLDGSMVQHRHKGATTHR